MVKLEKKISITIIIVIIIGVGYYIYSNYNNILSNEDLLVDNIEAKSDTKEDTEGNTVNNKQDTEEKIIIHISGAVNKEGIIELKEGSRIVDAVREAGGVKENASIKDINLAEKVEDGTKIYIPTIEEYNNYKEFNSILNSYNSQDKSNSTNQNQNVKVNINTATQDELERLPGIGSLTALKIINYRKENGKFKSIEDIKKVNRNRRKQI